MKARVEGYRHAAERQRLARLLACSPEALDFLRPLAAADLRDLRLACHDSLIRAQQPLAMRAVRASRMLPATLLASLGMNTLGARLCAQMSDQMSVTQLTDMCRRLPPSFLAEVARDLSIDKLCAVAEAFAPDLIHDITGETLVRRDHLLLGEVLNRLPSRLLPPVAGALHDGEALLRAVPLVEQPSRLQEVLELLPEAALRDSLQVAARMPGELLVPLLLLCTSAAPVWQRRLIRLLLETGDALPDTLLQALVEQELGNVVLPLVGRFSPTELERFMGLPAWRRAGTLPALLRHRRNPALRPWVLRLLEAMPPELAARAQALPEQSDLTRS